MLFLGYQAHSDLMDPLRARAAAIVATLGARANTSFGLRYAAAAWELFAQARLTHERPAYGINRVRTGNREVAVTEEPALVTPFGTLLRFAKTSAASQPRVLVVAPLSGHFATLLRGTVRTLLSEHDVFITDWHNGRNVGVEHGAFGFDEYVEHIIRFLEAIGPGAHVVAVCQPCVQVLAAVALMARAGHPACPRSMTLMAGPIDPRVNPTEVNLLATGRSFDWFEKNLIASVPARYAGARRRVYPGFLQLMAFMSMNLDRHIRAHMQMHEHLARGELKQAQAIRDFYEEYFAVLDLPAEFYLETISLVFQEARLPRGGLTFRGERVDPAAIRRTTLLTVEGERDDICAVGQTLAAHDLCTAIKPYMKRHHLQAGVGHYGVFSGRRWESQVYPIVRNHILASA